MAYLYANRLILGLFYSIIICLSRSIFADSTPQTALQQYVNTPDPAFEYTLLTTLVQPEASVYILQLTSQQWRSPEEVDRSLWQHQLSIIVPHNTISRTGMVFVNGGSNNDLGSPSNLLSTAATLAVGSGSVVSLLGQIPNQPLVFSDEPNEEKSEDDLIAYTFDKAMGSGDYTWPAYLPMVKSVVRAMDAIQAFLPEIGASTNLDNFVITGFSKRGATTWLTAAVDPRVIAIAPGVYDVLNFVPSFESHRASYGAFSEALAPYETYDVLDRIRIPEGRELLQVVDPFAYQAVLTMPKYIIAASGDEFFPVDSARFYASALQGENLFRYVPNTNHGGANGGETKALTGLLAWYQRIIAGQTHPQISWHRQGKRLRVNSSETPIQAVLWQAHNPTARDFRYNEVGPIWQASPLTPSAEGDFDIELETPQEGWSGFFIELSFAGLSSLPETYTTPVFITPNTRPFNLAQAINRPKNAAFWQQQFKRAKRGSANHRGAYKISKTPRIYSMTELEQLLPVRVFDTYIATVEQAQLALSPPAPHSSQQAAIKQCFATRLNIESEKLNWYSPVQYQSNKSKFLWYQWNRANRKFRRNRAGAAAKICKNLNKL